MGKNYIIACAVAVLSALLGVLFHFSASGEVFDARLWVVVAAGLGFVAWLVVRAKNLNRDEETGRSSSRLRKMALLWLGLAAVMGGGLVRMPVVEMWREGAAEVGVRSWIAGLAGVAVIVVVVVRWIPTWKERSDDE